MFFSSASNVLHSNRAPIAILNGKRFKKKISSKYPHEDFRDDANLPYSVEEKKKSTNWAISVVSKDAE